jgi:hypothetical protein
LLTKYSVAQNQTGIGYTGAWLNSKENLAGGLAFFVGQNIIETHNSSFSVSTNLKVGIEDKIGSGFVFPALFALAASGSNTSNVNTENLDGGKINLFMDFPILVHYNFGLRSSTECHKKFGFYFGGGMSYTTTGFTDTSGFSKSIGFFGYVIDGGIRFKENIDINFSNTISLRQPIGQIGHPIFYQITLSLRFKDIKYSTDE